VPDYAAMMANKAARIAKPQITIAGGVLCANRRTVAKNPHFAGVDLGGLEHKAARSARPRPGPRSPLPGPRSCR